MSKARLALALCCLLAAALCGCQTAKKIGAEFDPAQRPEQQAYLAVIEPDLAQAQDHDGVAMVMNAAALPLNEAVRQAQIQRRVAAFDLGPKAQAQAQAEAASALAKFHDVILGLYVPEDKWNNLASSEPTFVVYLQTPDGRKASPLDRRRLTRRAAIDEALYPFWGPWSKLYLMRFGLNDGDGKPLLAEGQNTVDLVITGAPGTLRLPLRLR